MIALIHIYCSTSLCVIYKSLLIHDIQVLIYRGSTNERLSGEGVAYDCYYNETDRVIILIATGGREISCSTKKQERKKDDSCCVIF